MPVVMAVLDAFPLQYLNAQLTPNLWRLAAAGGRSVPGGVGELPSVAYPNLATLVTGRSVIDHGVVASVVALDGEWVPAAEVGPEVATVFDACRAEGLRSAVIVGDVNLIGVCGAEAADTVWPSDPLLCSFPDRPAIERGVPDQPAADSQVAADEDVLDQLGGLDLATYDFVFVQLAELDQVGRWHGPASDRARAQVGATDAALGRLVAMLEPWWAETVLFVVSACELEEVATTAPIDLQPFLPDDVMVAAQGTAALVVGSVGPADLVALRGVAGFESLDADHHLVWGREGQRFGDAASSDRGDHGSPRTARQLAVVGGGTAKVAEFARRLDDQRPPTTVWASWVAEALGLVWRPELLSSVGGEEGQRDGAPSSLR